MKESKYKKIVKGLSLLNVLNMGIYNTDIQTKVTKYLKQKYNPTKVPKVIALQYRQ